MHYSSALRLIEHRYTKSKSLSKNFSAESKRLAVIMVVNKARRVSTTGNPVPRAAVALNNVAQDWRHDSKKRWGPEDLRSALCTAMSWAQISTVAEALQQLRARGGHSDTQNKALLRLE